MLPEFSLAIAESLYQSEEDFPIDLDFAWQWLGYSSKQKCLDKLLDNFEEKADFVTSGDFNQTVENCPPQAGRPKRKCYLSLECFKSMGMMAGTEKGKIVRKYFLECERVAYQKSLSSPKSQIDLAMSVSERVSLLAGLSPAIAAQLSLQAALAVQPQLAASLEPTMQALINSTANGDNLLSAKQLGDRLEISAQKVNKLLIEKGLQYKNESKGSSKEADYIATELGKEYSRVTQSAKGGSTFQQLRWLESVLEVLEAED